MVSGSFQIQVKVHNGLGNLASCDSLLSPPIPLRSLTLLYHNGFLAISASGPLHELLPLLETLFPQEAHMVSSLTSFPSLCQHHLLSEATAAILFIITAHPSNPPKPPYSDLLFRWHVPPSNILYHLPTYCVCCLGHPPKNINSVTAGIFVCLYTEISWVPRATPGT